MGANDSDIQSIVKASQHNLEAPLTHPAMPIQDAIDLAKFLVEVTVGFTRFTPGAQTVGGPVDIAAITKHDGLKWIMRKHYYDPQHN